MPRLPDVTTFGARPSLRTNRLDPVEPQGLEVADAVARSAQVFANLYAEKQQKDSRIRYALAKNEIMALDLQQREALKDRQDYENFDEAYQTGFTAGLDEILTRHDKLTPEDSALLQSEADLIRERSRVIVGDAARGLEVDLGRADTERFLQEALDNIHREDSREKRNELMWQALETVKAAEEDGWYSEEQSEVLLQTFATNAASNFIDAMEPEARLEELKLARAYRDRNGFLSRESAAKGEGSGSMGDYLPTYVLDKMIKATEDEIEIEGVERLGMEAHDRAWAAYPDVDQVRERDAMVRNDPALKDNPKARKEAQALNAARREREGVAQSLERSEISRELTNGIYVTDGMGQLSPSRLAKLTRQEQQSVRALQRQVREGREWNDEGTEWGAFSAWEQMSQEEKANWDENGTWQDAAGNNIHWKTSVHRDDAELMRQQSRVARNAGGEGGDYKGLTQEQQLERALVATPFFDRKPTAADDEDTRARWMRISTEFNRRLLELSADGVNIDGNVRDRVLANIINTVVRTEKGKNRDMIAVGVDPELYPETFIPLDRKVPMGGLMISAYDFVSPPERVGGTGGRVPAYTFIRNQLKASMGKEPSQRDIEEVWFYVITQGWDAAAARWSGAEGY